MKEIWVEKKWDKVVKVIYENLDENGIHELRISLYTDVNEYRISSKWNVLTEDIYSSYLGCICNCRKTRAGEENVRGNDLPDGKFTDDTWNRILSSILAYELVDVHKTESKALPDIDYNCSSYIPNQKINTTKTLHPLYQAINEFNPKLTNNDVVLQCYNVEIKTKYDEFVANIYSGTNSLYSSCVSKTYKKLLGDIGNKIANGRKITFQDSAHYSDSSIMIEAKTYITERRKDVTK